ncbi:hypothetical protein M8J76_000857 [Diaphorina citri]|nr:hypothetical protein M8J76_000857 [Diaphorina citri]KAI5725134.1 hypothetical protein M8J77_011399 [Diaphorina citri]
MDKDILIAEVLARPSLWNQKHPMHHHNVHLKKKWNEVAAACNSTAAAVTNQNRGSSVTSLPGTYFEILQRVHFDGEAVQFSKNIRSVKTGVGPLVKVRKSNKVLRSECQDRVAGSVRTPSPANCYCSLVKL